MSRRRAAVVQAWYRLRSQMRAQSSAGGTHGTPGTRADAAGPSSPVRVRVSPSLEVPVPPGLSRWRVVVVRVVVAPGPEGVVGCRVVGRVRAACDARVRTLWCRAIGVPSTSSAAVAVAVATAAAFRKCGAEKRKAICLVLNVGTGSLAAACWNAALSITREVAAVGVASVFVFAIGWRVPSGCAQWRSVAERVVPSCVHWTWSAMILRLASPGAGVAGPGVVVVSASSVRVPLASCAPTAA